VHVDGDVVNGMAACQPVVLVCVLCGGRMEALKKTHFFCCTLIKFFGGRRFVSEARVEKRVLSSLTLI
jgi:hypothetical protein